MQGEGNNKLGGNVGQTNLNQVPIQKGRDPLEFVVNKQPASNTNIAGSKSNQTRIINFSTTPKLPDPIFAAPSSKPSDSFFHKPALIPISDNNNNNPNKDSIIIPQSNSNNDNLLTAPDHQHHIIPNSNVQDNAVLNHNSSQNLLQTQSPYRNSFEDTSSKQKQQSYSISNLFGVNNLQNPSLQDSANDARLSFANNNTTNNRIGNTQRNREDNKILEKNLDEQFMELRKFGVSRDFILKGEELKGISDTQLKFGQYFVEGQLLLTNYKLLFVAADEDRISKFADRKDYSIIPLGFIAKIERSIEKKGLQYSFIDILCKDCRSYRFKYQPDLQNQSFEMQIKIHQLAFPEDVRKTFAYVYLQYDPSLEIQYHGWYVYDIQKEFSRQGLSIIPHDYSEQQEYDIDYKMSPFKYIDNSQANICSTYPDLLVVPSKMPFDEIIKCSRFRSRERLPVLTYAFKKRPNSPYTTLWRCAQCKPGINQNRSYEDESMLRFIGSLERSATTVKTVKIYDARPYLNAVGQQLAGKGYEMKQFYKNCEIEFLDIHNIHKVRESYKKFCNAMTVQSSEYIKELDKSDWLLHISSIIYGTKSIIDSLLNDISVVVHCSDGWDRTAQLICLSQICIDPYYRTIEGFEVLIEKDWVAFGYQFAIRTGHASKNFSDEQRSPIFLQFLDCVYQLTEQYPLSFQFNSKFLADIAYQLNASTFGTFLYNSYQEQFYFKAKSQTISLWSYLNSKTAEYENPFYLDINETNLSKLFPDGHVRKMKVWKEHFLIYSNEFSDPYHIYQECNFADDNKNVLKRSSQMRYESFKEENKILHKKNEDLEMQLAIAQSKNAIYENQGGAKYQAQMYPQIPAFSKNPMMQQNEIKKDSKKEEEEEEKDNKDYEKTEKQEQEAKVEEAVGSNLEKKENNLSSEMNVASIDNDKKVELIIIDESLEEQNKEEQPVLNNSNSNSMDLSDSKQEETDKKMKDQEDIQNKADSVEIIEENSQNTQEEDKNQEQQQLIKTEINNETNLNQEIEDNSSRQMQESDQKEGVDLIDNQNQMKTNELDEKQELSGAPQQDQQEIDGKQ